MRRILPALLSLAVAAGAVVAGSVPAAAQGAPDRPTNGRDAVAALGDRLPAVAAENHTTAELLRQRLLTDPSLWVDREGRLVYIDTAPAPDGHAVPSAPVAATPAREQVMSLHSNPGAQRTIYLDVDGVGGTFGGEIGGSWSRGYTGGDGVAEPYSLDSVATADFSSEELADIYSIWQRVAEDFASFDIDVTTQEPTEFETINRYGTADQVYGTRVAITSSATDCGCGGVAYVGVFDATRRHASTQPAFVYNEGAKYAAEAASHEAGHNLGLSHDGRKNEDGTTDNYYLGHNDWSPIMGVGYYTSISQWSKGDYPGATNTEDDFAVAGLNGAPLRPDATTTPQLTIDAAAGTAGRIERNGDTDEFTLTVPHTDGTGAPVPVAIEARTAFVSANLDLALTVIAEGSTAGTTDNPQSDSISTDAASGMGASFVGELSPGRYVVRVQGVGSPTGPLIGYPAYGSVGTYTLTAKTSPQPLTIPAAPEGLAATLATDATYATLTWTDLAPNEAGYALVMIDSTDTVEQKRYTYALAANRTSYVHRSVGKWTYELQAVSSAGASTAAKTSNAVIVVAPTTTKTRGGGKK